MFTLKIHRKPHAGEEVSAWLPVIVNGLNPIFLVVWHEGRWAPNRLGDFKSHSAGTSTRFLSHDQLSLVRTEGIEMEGLGL